ncbi:MAG TPA: hypothetical protein VIX82_15145 [Solirubrobacteraceae bacterium]
MTVAVGGATVVVPTTAWTGVFTGCAAVVLVLWAGFALARFLWAGFVFLAVVEVVVC